LRGLLEEAGIDIVGEAAHGESGARPGRGEAPERRDHGPQHAGIGGIEATRQITTVAPLTRVIMLTVSSAAPEITDACSAGACGYLLKSATTQEIVAGIAAAARGDALLSPSVAARHLERVRETPVRPSVPDPASGVADRARARGPATAGVGMDNAEIGRTLFHQPEHGEEPQSRRSC
jgi:DNA-binding NarL/FixJ family response regulator